MVVDPEVGSDRKALALETDWGFFVGPDNGVLSPAAAMVGGARVMVSIENPEAMIPSPGADLPWPRCIRPGGCPSRLR